MRIDARANPKYGTIEEHIELTATCVNCGGPIHDVPQVPGISGIPRWTHVRGGKIPNYQCSDKTGPDGKAEPSSMHGDDE